jgi:aquaporin Z
MCDVLENPALQILSVSWYNAAISGGTPFFCPGRRPYGKGALFVNVKKYVAEFIGTAVLVLLGCGTAMLVGCDAASGGGYILTALAFGLSIVAMAYSIGNISGCHINPAVSLAVLISGGMSVTDFVGYVIAQCLGALAGSGVLAAIFGLGGVTDMTGGFGSNGLSGVNGSIAAGLLVEIVLTFIFVMAILGVTSKKAKHGSFGGLVIGLTLVLVHILGIGLTGTSVNPARSIGPAIVAAISGNTAPLGCLWVFILAPLVGAALAAVVYKALEKNSK